MEKEISRFNDIEINSLQMANVIFPKIPMAYLDILVLATIIIKIIFSNNFKNKNSRS